MSTTPGDLPAAKARPGGAGEPTAGGSGSRRRSARRTFAATVLVLESFVVLFATLVAFGLRVAPPGIVWAAGGTLAALLLLLVRPLHRPGGYLAGSLVQGLVLAGGLALFAAQAGGATFVATITTAVGVIFAALWVVGLRLGGRIDRERAQWDAAHPGG
jgi:hypothetical protein